MKRPGRASQPDLYPATRCLRTSRRCRRSKSLCMCVRTPPPYAPEGVQPFNRSPDSDSNNALEAVERPVEGGFEGIQPPIQPFEMEFPDSDSASLDPAVEWLNEYPGETAPPDTHIYSEPCYRCGNQADQVDASAEMRPVCSVCVFELANPPIPVKRGRGRPKGSKNSRTTQPSNQQQATRNSPPRMGCAPTTPTIGRASARLTARAARAANAASASTWTPLCAMSAGELVGI
jgi:hypothetical protein